MTVYLCTCGTSSNKKIPRDQKFGPEWVTAQGGVEDAAKTLYNSFSAYRINDDKALTQHLSAEIHSLARLGVKATDRVILFSSETPDGQACALALQQYLQHELPGLECKVEIIQGLQVRNADIFRRVGVIEFLKAVLRAIDANGSAQCILNPTGGFKSLVPYTVLIGMLKSIPAHYIFEQSSALISLPVMPVDFARERIEPIRHLLERIQQNSSIPKTDFFTAVPYEERATLEVLFESEGDQFTMSPVGFLVWEALERPTALVPYLSHQALDDLVKIRTIEGTKPVEFIQRVARSNDALRNATHDSWSNNLRWLKPGEHTRDRYLVSVEGWRLLIWRIVDHMEYDDFLQRKRTGNPELQIQRDRKSKYEPFIRMDLYESP